MAESVAIHERAPDVRGPTAPLPATILGMGIGSLALVVGGLAVLQVAQALSDQPFSPACVSPDLTAELTGARGICNILLALRSPAQTVFLVSGIAIGLVAIAAGFSSYKRMDTRRKREQAITGAVLGIQAVAVAALLLWFRSGRPETFAKNLLNFARLEGYGGASLRAAKNTLILAFGGEIGGILIGLILSILAISGRRAVRAPARLYINFFRGTPLIWQLSFGYFVFLLGFDLRLSAFTAAILIFALNTGAYAAEVFRAGLQSIERGQIEAARSLGMSYLQAMRYAIVPQAVRRVIPPLMNEFVILIKDTALVSIVGLTAAEYELFTLAREGQADTFNATFFTAVAFAYLAITLPLIRLVNIVEHRLHSGLVGIAGAGH